MPAGYQRLRVLIEPLGDVPDSTDKVLVSSETAGYQLELLRRCAAGKDEPLGVIELAVGVDVTPEFKRPAAKVAEEEWQTLEREVHGHRAIADQQWAECASCRTG